MSTVFVIFTSSFIKQKLLENSSVTTTLVVIPSCTGWMLGALFQPFEKMARFMNEAMVFC
jgi:hypothetical protein